MFLFAFNDFNSMPNCYPRICFLRKLKDQLLQGYMGEPTKKCTTMFTFMINIFQTQYPQ